MRLQIQKKRWRCTRCKSSKTILKNTFFAKRHVPLNVALLVGYCWLTEVRYTTMQRFFPTLSSRTVVKLMTEYR